MAEGETDEQETLIRADDLEVLSVEGVGGGGGGGGGTAAMPPLPSLLQQSPPTWHLPLHCAALVVVSAALVIMLPVYLEVPTNFFSYAKGNKKKSEMREEWRHLLSSLLPFSYILFSLPFSLHSQSTKPVMHTPASSSSPSSLPSPSCCVFRCAIVTSARWGASDHPPPSV